MPPAVPPINIGTMLGQLASGPPVGPIATTPYAPTNVQPLWMPSEAPGKPPKITQPAQQNPFQFGGGAGGYNPAAGGPMPGTSQGAPRNTDAVPTGADFSQLTPAQQQARIAAGNAPPPTYGANVFAKALASQGINPSSVMPNYAARVAQSQPQAQAAAKLAAPAAKPQVPQTSIHPAAAQSLSQTLTNMGVPSALHPQVMQSVLNPSLLGQGSPRNI